MGWPKKTPAPVLIVLLLAIVFFGAWLRFRQADDSLWLDELHTAWVAQAGGDELVTRATMGNQSPLYFYGVAAISNLLGPSEISIRLLSLLSGSLLPLVVAWLARRLLAWDGQAGRQSYVPVLAAWLVAVDPTAIFYAQEARPYACVQLLAVLHVMLLVELLQHPTRLKRLGWIMCGGLLFFLHYTAILVIVAEVAFALGWLFYRARKTGHFDRPALAYLIVDVLCVILLFLPALVPLREIYQRRHNWALFVDRVGLAEIIDLPKMIPWSAAALLYLLAYTVASATRHPLSLRERARVREDGSQQDLAIVDDAARGQKFTYLEPTDSSSLLLCWLTIPIAIVAITSATDWLRLWHVRYLIGVTPAAILLAAMLPRLVRGRFGLVVILTIALYAGWSSHRSLDWTSPHGNPQRSEDWRSAVAFLNRQTDGHPLLLRSGLIEADSLRTWNDETLIDYCRFPLASLYRLNRSMDEVHPLTMTAAGKLTQTVHMKIAPPQGKSQSIWLVVRGDERRADEIVREMQQLFAASHTDVKTVNQHSFGRVQVQQLELHRTAAAQ